MPYAERSAGAGGERAEELLGVEVPAEPVEVGAVGA
jgi:hypothetical protein